MYEVRMTGRFYKNLLKEFDGNSDGLEEKAYSIREYNLRRFCRYKFKCTITPTGHLLFPNKKAFLLFKLRHEDDIREEIHWTTSRPY